MSNRIVAETSLFPHANPGIMDEPAIAGLRPSNVSMGLMLENISPRLMEPGMPHFECPDKDPALRIATIEAAGRQQVPFTSGILVGIGETEEELVDSLFALAAVQSEWGHLQEIIVQNFRAKADTRMRNAAEPAIPYFARIVALARWIMGAEMNLQVPPNLSDDFGLFLDAGINDWGGVSPLTIDWVNPEAPWPHLEKLRAVTEDAGFELKPRLPVYPEFITERWIDQRLLTKVRSAVDADGFAAFPETVSAP
jgi:FO synthase